MIKETIRDILPPNQYLIMEVCAARYRLGEKSWTFPASLTNAVRSLEIRRMVTWKQGTVPNTIQVTINKSGLKTFLSSEYAPIGE